MVNKMIKVYKVEFFCNHRGHYPCIDWLAGLRDGVAKARIDARFRQIEHGNLGDHKPITGGIHEMRLHVGPGYRFYYGGGNDTLIFLWGGKKDSQHYDIQKALQFWYEYLSEEQK